MKTKKTRVAVTSWERGNPKIGLRAKCAESVDLKRKV
jgi:hypothetical protein